MLGGGKSKSITQYSRMDMFVRAWNCLKLDQVKSYIAEDNASSCIARDIEKVSKKCGIVFQKSKVTALMKELDENPSPARVRCCLIALFATAKGSNINKYNAITLMRHDHER